MFFNDLASNPCQPQAILNVIPVHGELCVAPMDEEMSSYQVSIGAEPKLAQGLQRATMLAEEEDATRMQGKEMEAFLSGVERSAYRIADLAIRDADEALDLVQDAMIKLVRRYADRPEEEWRPLFYKILHNRIRDWHRRRAVRSKVMSLFSPVTEEGYDLIAEAPDPVDRDPQKQLQRDDALDALGAALKVLPARQREAFVLRNLEEMSVAETAMAMGCSEGSVKTHYSRAVHKLRETLGAYW